MHKLLFPLIAFIFLFGCQTEFEKIDTKPINIITSKDVLKAYPNRTGVKGIGYMGGHLIEYEIIDGKIIFQGDIILRPEQVSATLDNGRTEGAIVVQGMRWPNNTVPYEIDPDLDDKYRVTEAIAHFHEKTSVKLVPRTTEENYVIFLSSEGCSSNVGMHPWEGPAWIHIGIECSTGNIIHEIAHTLGMWHEQSRSDRDDHITIHYDNIYPYASGNFNYYWEGEGEDHGAFDFNSIMLYFPYAFSMNGEPTITKKDGSVYEANWDYLSKGDIAAINHMYPPILVELPNIVEYFDRSIQNKELVGVGPGNSAPHRVNAFRNKLLAIQKTLEKNKTNASNPVSQAQRHIHISGQIGRNHFITGKKSKEFYDLLNLLKN